MKVEIKRVRGVPLPEYQTAGAAGFDIAVAEDVTVVEGGLTMAPTGLVVAIPQGYMLLILPRSSTFKKWGVTLANTIGVIDSDYCGPEDELRLALTMPAQQESGYSFSTIIKMPKGTRIAQGLIVPVVQAQFVEVEEMVAPTRGGFGSTG